VTQTLDTLFQKTTKFYIDGEWVTPLATTRRAVESPATEEVLAFIIDGSAADADRAVTAAKRSFDSWSTTLVMARRALVETLLQIYLERYEDMARVISLEVGAPITMSREQQAEAGCGHIKGFLDALQELEWQTKLPSGDWVVREPIGVVGMITPWNWPINQIALKVIPALLTGCTVVLKPSEVAPLSAMLFAEMIASAGFPAGVFNLINGEGMTVGSALSRHPDVAMMSFTGSTRAGVAVSTDAAPTVKRVTLELGGKSANIVFADCDLNSRIAASVRECFNNSGQSCDAPTRMLVEQSVYESALAIARQAAENQPVGNPDDEGDHIGPLISAVQWSRVQKLIEAGLSEGARLLAGGPGRPMTFARGHFVKPTIFADVTPDMKIWRDEVFGPVLTITPFENEDHAVALANDTEYGLAAYIQTGSPERALRVARRLRAGMVHVNGAAYNYGSPFGGYGLSGNGREGGVLGLEDFLETKTLHGIRDVPG
jgi:aldehyde dehydrogenase (NAD+)